MSLEDTSRNHFASIESLLDEAERYCDQGNTPAALSSLETAVSKLCSTGSGILSDIPETDVAALDGHLATVLRRLAERADLLPENFATILSITGIPASLGDEFADKSADPLSAEEIVEALKLIHTAPDEMPKDPENDISLLKTLIDLLNGQKTVSEVIFSDNGAYDMLADAASPYLVTGAVYLSGDGEDTGEKIQKMMEGPIKRLVRLLFSLLTSAFISGLLLLIVRRILAVRKMRPGFVENAAFAASVFSLTAVNIPVMLEGLRAAAHELKELSALITTS
jgi:hypothetical protein